MKENTLFGAEQTEPLPLLEIYKPTEKELHQATVRLGILTKDTIMEMALPFVIMSKKHRMVFKGEEPMGVPNVIRAMRNSGAQSKKTWVDFLCLFMNRHNLPLLFADMPPRLADLWRETLRRHYVQTEHADLILGQHCMGGRRHGYGTQNLSDELNGYFGCVRGLSAAEACDVLVSRHFLCLPDWMYGMLLPVFFTDSATVRHTDTLPDGLHTFTAEMAVIAKLPMLNALYDNKKLSFGASPRLTAAAVKRLQKLVPMPEFFASQTDDKLLSCLCSAMTYNTFCLWRTQTGRKKRPDAPEEQIKAALTTTLGDHAFLLSLVLPYIKGFKRSCTVYANTTANVANMLMDVLGKWHDKQWLAVEDIIMHVRTSSDRAEKDFLLMGSYEFDRMEMKNGYTDMLIGYDNNVSMLSEPFVRGLLLLFAACGMVELACGDVQTDGDTPYSCLRYVRVTPLGQWLLGRAESYDNTAADDEKPLFELDGEHLFIKSPGDNSVAETFMADYAEHITAHLYRVDYESFIKGCSTAKDVEQKIDTFLRYVCATPPPIWTSFFDDLRQRSRPFSAPSDKYTIMQVTPDDKLLQRLLLTEPSIRCFVTKAEGYMVLVKTADMPQFAAALRKHGYLV